MKLSPKFLAVLRKLLFAAVAIATAFALFIAVENWRGARAWNATAQDLAARGEPTDLAAIQPTRVPDGENFFKTPLLAKVLYERPNDPERVATLTAMGIRRYQALVAFRSSDARDFTGLRDRLRGQQRELPATESPAADMLVALQPIKPLLDEVREAARTRPLAALAPRETPLGPPLVDAHVVHMIGTALAVRGAAELALGQNDGAAADILAAQRLGNALADRPATLLNIMVALAIHGFAGEAVSAGCQSQAWNEAQLTRFAQNMEALQPLANFREALRAERVQVLYALDVKPAPPGMMPTWPSWLFSGWAQQNKVNYSRRLDSDILTRIQLAPDRISPLPPAYNQPASRTAKFSLLSPYSGLSDLALSNIGNVLLNFGESAERCQLATLSWAIERHRLAKGRVPGTLDELVPTFLPKAPLGIFDGQPLRMSTGPKGEILLYSSGKNGRDEGGRGDDIVFPRPDSA